MCHVPVYQKKKWMFVCSGSRKRLDVPSIHNTDDRVIHTRPRSAWMQDGRHRDHRSACSERNFSSRRCAEGSSSWRLGDKRWRQEQTSGHGYPEGCGQPLDIIANKLLGMDGWEQTEIDKLLVETLDGTKNEWCWSRANFRADATLAISMTVCRAGAADSEVSLCTYISRLTDKPQTSL